MVLKLQRNQRNWSRTRAEEKKTNEEQSCYHVIYPHYGHRYSSQIILRFGLKTIIISNASTRAWK